MIGKSRRGTCVFYPIQVRLRYEVEKELLGHGRTVGLSREIVRFECDEQLRLGSPVRLILMWPATLPDGTPLNLWITGRVARNFSHQVEVRVLSYEFRTRPGIRRAETSISRGLRESDPSPIAVKVELRP